MATVTALPHWCTNMELIDAARRCIDCQREPATHALANFAPCADAQKKVDEQTLRALLKSGRDVHGVSSEGDISNAVVFNAPHIEDAVLSDKITKLKKTLDDIVTRKAETELKMGVVNVRPSGQFWYPPSGYMSWHTNSRAPGLRLYISFAAEPGKSFFRYLDVDTDQVNTIYDDGWNVRLFPIEATNHFWHAVYSETDRFSFGYMIVPAARREAVRRRLKRFLRWPQNLSARMKDAQHDNS